MWFNVSSTSFIIPRLGLLQICFQMFLAGKSSLALTQSTVADERGETTVPTQSSNRAPRPVRRLQYGPLLAHFMSKRSYKCKNLIRPLAVAVTASEERQKMLDVKAKYVQEQCAIGKKKLDKMNSEFKQIQSEGSRAVRAKVSQVKFAKKRLDQRKKEVLGSENVKEYANYITSILKMQHAGEKF